MFKSHRQKGNTLAEYCLVAMLVVASSIGAWGLLGGGLNLNLEAMAKEMKSKGNRAQTAETNRIAAKDAHRKAEALANAANQGLHNASWNDVIETGVDPIVTTGGNGSTREMLNALKLSLKHAVDAGNLTPQQSNMANALANKGHSLAKMQSLLEKARFDAQGSADRYDAMRLDYNGRQYAPQELARQLTNEIEAFSKILWDTQNSGLDPKVVAVISAAGPKIVDYAAAARSIGLTTQQALLVGVGENKGDPQDVHYADDTHGRSVEVCNANGQTDSGKWCTP